MPDLLTGENPAAAQATHAARTEQFQQVTQAGEAAFAEPASEAAHAALIDQAKAKVAAEGGIDAHINKYTGKDVKGCPMEAILGTVVFNSLTADAKAELPKPVGQQTEKAKTGRDVVKEIATKLKAEKERAEAHAVELNRVSREVVDSILGRQFRAFTPENTEPRGTLTKAPKLNVERLKEKVAPTVIITKLESKPVAPAIEKVAIIYEAKEAVSIKRIDALPAQAIVVANTPEQELSVSSMQKSTEVAEAVDAIETAPFEAKPTESKQTVEILPDAVEPLISGAIIEQPDSAEIVNVAAAPAVEIFQVDIAEASVLDEMGAVDAGYVPVFFDQLNSAVTSNETEQSAAQEVVLVTEYIEDQPPVTEVTSEPYVEQIAAIESLIAEWLSQSADVQPADDAPLFMESTILETKGETETKAKVFATVEQIVTVLTEAVVDEKQLETLCLQLFETMQITPGEETLKAIVQDLLALSIDKTTLGETMAMDEMNGLGTNEHKVSVAATLQAHFAWAIRRRMQRIAGLSRYVLAAINRPLFGPAQLA